MSSTNNRATVNQLVQNRQIEQPNLKFSQCPETGQWECVVELTQNGKNERATAMRGTKAEAHEAALSFLTLPKIVEKGPKVPIGEWKIISTSDNIIISYVNAEGQVSSLEHKPTSNIHPLMMKLHKQSQNK